MALQNIGASNKDDAFYRYKMPKMKTKIESQGNGIRTKIVNMAAVAKALARPASSITNYFKHELGALTEFHEETGASVVRGAHDTAKLAGHLEMFISKYVLCNGCGNPETEILVSRTMTVSLKCAACGFVSDVGTRDKIFKNQTEHKNRGKVKNAMQRAGTGGRLGEGDAADEQQKKLKKDAKKKGGSSKGSTAKSAATNKAAAGGSKEDHSNSPTHSQDGDNVADEDDDDDDVQWQTDTSLEAAKQRMQEQLSAVTAAVAMVSVDGSEKRKQAPEKAIAIHGSAKRPDHGSAEHPDSPDEKQTTVDTSPYDELVEQIRTCLGKAATATQLRGVMSSSTLLSQGVMNALFEAPFEGVGNGFKKEVMKKKEYLTAAVPDKSSQVLLLQAIEAFGSKCSVEALKEVPFVLEALYHDDVLEEETIVQWYNAAVAGGRNSRVLKTAKLFV